MNTLYIVLIVVFSLFIMIGTADIIYGTTVVKKMKRNGYKPVYNEPVSIDFSSMTKEELVSLRRDLNEEINKKSGE